MSNPGPDRRTRARVAILFTGTLLAESFERSGALDRLCATSEVHCLTSRDIEASRPRPRYRTERTFDGRATPLHRLAFDLETLWARRRSPAFGFRLRRSYLGSHQIRGPRTALLAAKILLASCLRGGWQSPLIVLGLGLLVPRSWVRRHLHARIAPDHRLLAWLKETDPDIVIIPSAAYEAVAMDAIVAARILGIRSLMIAHNWDNLSSKSVLWHLPDHLAVWGHQSLTHAVQIQRMPADRVHVIGNPRSSGPRRPDGTGDKSGDAGRGSIVFLGCAIPHMETPVVRALAESTSTEAVLSGRPLIYRPHPFRQDRLIDDDPAGLVGSAGVTVDLAAFSGTSSHLEVLLADCDVVVGPLTTALLEAVASGLPVIALTNDDGIHRTTAARALMAYPHLRDLPRLRGLSVCSDPRALPGIVAEAVAEPTRASHRDQDLDVDHFMWTGNDSYSDRLNDLVLSICAID